MSQYSEMPIVLSMSVKILPDSKQAFTHWQALLNAAITGFPGFVSLEFLAPEKQEKEWWVIQRFSTLEAITAWKLSDQYKLLIKDLKELAVSNKINEVTSNESSLNAGVTQIIFTEVHPQHIKVYQQWSSKIHLAEATFPGFRGVYIQSPEESNGKHWITLLQFDTMQNLDNWLDSAERRQLLNEATPWVNTFESQRVISPYAGWFASIAKVGEEVPAIWKQTMIVLLALFPIVMLEFKYLTPLTTGLDISLATFIGNALSVSLISFPMMPIAIKFLGWWLSPSPRQSNNTSLIGTLIVLGLYLLEITVFWNFL